MTINWLPLLFAGLCFASFVWGMVWHFRRVGKPTRAMLAMALLAAVFGSLQIVALVHRRNRFQIPALALYAAGAALFWWSASVTRGKLSACGQGAVSPQVVTRGPYNYIRHPFYTSYNLTWVAGFAATAWWPLMIAAVVMAALYERAAREEELGLSSGPRGGDYNEYKRRTGRYLPRIAARPAERKTQ